MFGKNIELKVHKTLQRKPFGDYTEFLLSKFVRPGKTGNLVVFWKSLKL